MCSTRLENMYLNETRKSISDPGHRYVAFGANGSTVTKAAACLPNITPDNYKLGMGKAKSDTKTGKPRIYSDVVMVGKDPFFILNKWTIKDIILEGVSPKVLSMPPRMNNGKPDRKIGVHFVRIGLPKLSIAPMFESMKESMPSIQDSYSKVTGIYWLNAS
ncbi:hypothetical protein PGQ11_002868 [Apiospora arundinis]|uniref:Uncharacterized protein n=1 Tax=Apiospora arundinis TaxID=335852 RepID=A0ABR2J3Y7_9PEZI